MGFVWALGPNRFQAHKVRPWGTESSLRVLRINCNGKEKRKRRKICLEDVDYELFLLCCEWRWMREKFPPKWFQVWVWIYRAHFSVGNSNEMWIEIQLLLEMQKLVESKFMLKFKWNVNEMHMLLVWNELLLC